MPNILTLIPIRPTLPPALQARARELAPDGARLRICKEEGKGYRPHAQARNTMLDLYLKKEHTHVLWIDADLVEYPKNLGALLLERDAEGIIAPLPLIEGTDRFYDVYGFVDSRGRRIERPYNVHFDGPMQSVGTCYLMPASIFHAGARYTHTEGHTEHYSICRKASRVTVANDVIIRHADLPRYGEAYH